MSLPLSGLLTALETLAPLALAEPWDNVGLLLDPRADGAELEVARVLLTIDATPAVLEEAVGVGAECLVAYHPPLFHAKKRLSRVEDPVLWGAVQQGLAVYSPHTALDAVRGGVNDWLAEAFAPARVSALVPSERADVGGELKLVVFVPAGAADRLRSALSEAGAGVIGNYSECSFALPGEGTFFGEEGAQPAVGEVGCLSRVPELRLEMVCPRRALSRVAEAIEQHHPYEEPAWEVYPLAPKVRAHTGAGRMVELAAPRGSAELVSAVKRHLGLAHARLALAECHAAGAPIRRIAVCAGSGGALFERVSGVDLIVTGELGHHQVLAKLREGTSVVLTEHSNSERGYLTRLRDRLVEATAARVEVRLAERDVEPLRVI